MAKAASSNGFLFGLEAEYLLIDQQNFKPLWYQDLDFAHLNNVLESIPFDDLPPLDGLELEPPHRKLMPYVVEGYHLPGSDDSAVGLLPKGIEIRTPVCRTIEESLSCLSTLHNRLQAALADIGCKATALSHHPTMSQFEGVQNKRRYDYWRWAKEAMTTYGPDINVSLPQELRQSFSPDDLERRVNFYGPALTALTLASPFRDGALWLCHGRVGKSLRTHRRSIFAPIIELHPEENGRCEFKSFEMTQSLIEFHAYYLLWLELLLDDGLEGTATYQTRIYDLGSIARDGLAVEGVTARAKEVLDRAQIVLPQYGFDPAPLSVFANRLQSGKLPADDLTELFDKTGSIQAVCNQMTDLMEAPVTTSRQPT